MVALFRIIVQNVVCVPVIVHEEFGQEFRREGRGIDEQLELETLVLQPVAYLKRPPCETGILGIPL